MSEASEFFTLTGYQRNEISDLSPAMEDYLEMICRLLSENEDVRINALSEKLKTASTADEALSIIRHFARSPTFKQAVYKIVKAMVTQVAAGNQKSWRAAAAKGSREHRFNL